MQLQNKEGWLRRIRKGDARLQPDGRLTQRSVVAFASFACCVPRTNKVTGGPLTHESTRTDSTWSCTSIHFQPELHPLCPKSWVRLETNKIKHTFCTLPLTQARNWPQAPGLHTCSYNPGQPRALFRPTCPFTGRANPHCPPLPSISAVHQSVLQPLPQQASQCRAPSLSQIVHPPLHAPPCAHQLNSSTRSRQPMRAPAQARLPLQAQPVPAWHTSPSTALPRARVRRA